MKTIRFLQVRSLQIRFLQTFPFACCFLFIVSAFSVQNLSAQNVPVKELLQPYIDSGELPGIVTVIADKSGVLQIDAVGYADLETKRPMTEDTLFWMASQTKQITAAAVMMLVEEGKVKLDEPLTTYLPEMKDIKVVAEKQDGRIVLVPPDKPLTLRMCLSHTAGFAFLTPFAQRHGIDSLPVEKAQTTYVMTPLAGQPLKQYIYSNIGINVASTAVQRVSGVPFEKFLKERLFDPLEMKETTFFPTAEQLKRIANPYKLNKDTNKLEYVPLNFLTYPLDSPERYPEGGGGLFSTPKEWVRIYQMFANEGTFNGKKILSPESIKEIRTKQTGELPENYGLGVNIGGDIFGHGGSHGTESKVNYKTGRIAQYYIQQAGLPKANEAVGKFMKAAYQEK